MYKKKKRTYITQSAGFSLVFSTTGKGPFQTGKAFV